MAKEKSCKTCIMLMMHYTAICATTYDGAKAEIVIDYYGARLKKNLQLYTRKTPLIHI